MSFKRILTKYDQTFQSLLEYDQGVSNNPCVTSYLSIDTDELHNELEWFIKTNQSSNKHFGTFIHKNNSLYEFADKFVHTIEEMVDVQNHFVEHAIVHSYIYLVQNHLFHDGNKRIASYMLLYMLQSNQILTKRLTPDLLTVITILVAKSSKENHRDLRELICNTIF